MLRDGNNFRNSFSVVVSVFMGGFENVYVVDGYGGDVCLSGRVF